MSFHYRALGLTLTAPFPCPGFWPTEQAEVERSITLNLGTVPAALDELIYDRPLVQIDRAGNCLHHIPGIARYLICNRRQITLDLHPTASLERAIGFLRGVPLAFLCLQWGMMPLKAAGVVIDGRAVLFTGGTACGKSTLTLALAQRGHKVLGDDLCAFDPVDSNNPVIWPSFPVLRLYEDSLNALAPTLPLPKPEPSGRLAIAADPWFSNQPVPPGTMVVLNFARGGVAAAVTPQRGLNAFESLMNHTPLADLTRPPLSNRPRIAIAANLVNLMTVHNLWYKADLNKVNQQAQHLMEIIPSWG